MFRFPESENLDWFELFEQFLKENSFLTNNFRMKSQKSQVMIIGWRIFFNNEKKIKGVCRLNICHHSSSSVRPWFQNWGEFFRSDPLKCEFWQSKIAVLTFYGLFDAFQHPELLQKKGYEFWTITFIIVTSFGHIFQFRSRKIENWRGLDQGTAFRPPDPARKI